MSKKTDLQASLDAKGLDYTKNMTNTKLQSILDEAEGIASVEDKVIVEDGFVTSVSLGFDLNDLAGEEREDSERNIQGTFQEYVEAVGKANGYANPIAYPTENAVDANSTTRFALEIGDEDEMETNERGILSFTHSKRITCSESVSKMLKSGAIGYSELGAFPVAWRMLGEQDRVTKLFVEKKVFFIERLERKASNNRFKQGGFTSTTDVNYDFEEVRTELTTLRLG